MKKEFEGLNGKKLLVEDGKIYCNGELLHDGVYRHHITEIKDAPKSLLDSIAKNKLDMTGRVYVGGAKFHLTVMREVAEEAARQTEEIRAATDPLNVIEGYKELKAAYADVGRYHMEFDRMMEDEGNDGARLPNPVKIDPKELAKKYPRAEAYIEAERYSNAGHYAKTAAGEKAKKRIIAGEDYTAVLADMEAEWHKAAEEAVWNS